MSAMCLDGCLLLVRMQPRGWEETGDPQMLVVRVLIPLKCLATYVRVKFNN